MSDEKMTHITFQIPADLALAIRIRAAEQNISRSEAIRRALTDYLDSGQAQVDWEDEVVDLVRKHD